MKIKYRQFKKDDVAKTSDLMKDFYRETPGNSVISNKNIKRTFDEFSKNPEKGTIIIIESDNSVIGYAILLKVWSNEHSKDIIFIDELFVKKEFRNKGIGSASIKYIIDKFGDNAALLILDVEPGNEKAKRLYKQIGFKLNKNETLVYKI